MKKNIVSNRVAIIIFAIALGLFGIGHLIHASEMPGMLSGYPVPGFWSYLVDVILILSAICFFLNWKAKVAGYILALVLLILIVWLDIPGVARGDMMAHVMLHKDLAIFAGSILVANQSA